VKIPKTFRDLDDVWQLGDWVLRCQMIYSEELGGGASWIIERADRMPLTKGGSAGLMLAFFDHKEKAPLQQAYEIIKAHEDELAAIW
jgi:hypothetical protein